MIVLFIINYDLQIAEENCNIFLKSANDLLSWLKLNEMQTSCKLELDAITIERKIQEAHVRELQISYVCLFHVYFCVYLFHSIVFAN